LRPPSRSLRLSGFVTSPRSAGPPERLAPPAGGRPTRRRRVAAAEEGPRFDGRDLAWRRRTAGRRTSRTVTVHWRRHSHDRLANRLSQRGRNRARWPCRPEAAVPAARGPHVMGMAHRRVPRGARPKGGAPSMRGFLASR
jgi:hypothetical protein